jgi:hypothetical protein
MVGNLAPVVHAAYAQAWAAVDPGDRAVTTASLQRLHAGLESRQA